MKRIFSMLAMALLFSVGSFADDYYLGANPKNEGWVIMGQFTDQDGDGVYSYTMDMTTSTVTTDRVYLTVFKSSTIDWTQALRPKDTNKLYLNGNPVNELGGSNDNTFEFYTPNSAATSVTFNFNPVTNAFFIIKNIGLETSQEDWENPVSMTSATSDEIYSVEYETLSENVEYKFLAANNTNGGGTFTREAKWYGYKNDNGEWLATDGSNMILSSKGKYEVTANFNTFRYTAPNPLSMTIEIGSVGYATYSGYYALDFSDTSVNAYIASEISGNNVIMTKVTQVPANTGLFLQGTTASIPVIASAEAVGTNLLKAADGSLVAASTDALYHYVFANQNNEPGFYNLVEALTIPAGKAYLETTTALTTGVNAKVALSFEGEATGIKDVNAVENNDWYTINGIRVAVPTKGLYIHNGKKVMVK